jgi:thiamine-monophosphate kinase
MNEFELIRSYFQQPSFPTRADVILGIGDDAALCRVPPQMELAVSVDTLVAGVHFPLDSAPEDIGYKALAVNLSDLAAMAAQPAWFTLALTLPSVDTDWLHGFSMGLSALASDSGIALIGGDTTRGPLSISIQVMGWVAAGQGLRRSGACPGDDIYVTGTLGDAGLGLHSLQQPLMLSAAGLAYVRARLHRPTPRLAWGQALRGVAHSAIDISDGLAADLGHILTQSSCGAELYLDHLPLSPALHHLPKSHAWTLALGAGDDYELCFTLPHAVQPSFPCTRVGTITAQPTLRCLDSQGHDWHPPTGYRHF